MSVAGAVLDRESILRMLEGPSPLVEGYLDLDNQIQPNGFDLTLKEVLQFTSPGELKAGESPSALAGSEALPFGPGGYLHLAQGSYLITLNEIVDLPHNIMALARPRSSLLRSGVSIHTAVWDAGYRGRSQALLTVHNAFGYRLSKGARLLQMVFMYLASPVAEGYSGRYQNENIHLGQAE
jgi:dUTP pyrophosphatase